jgi:hypothetical protein
MVKQTDFAENIIQRGTVSILADEAAGNGDGNLEVVGNTYCDILRSNTDVLPIDIEQVEIKEKNITMNENSLSIPIPSTDKYTFFIKDGLLKSINSSNILTTYQPTTTKGDLLSHNGTTQVRLPYGPLNFCLVSDPSTDSGLKWVPYTTKFIQKFVLIGKDPDNSEILLEDSVFGNYFNLIGTETKQGPLGINFLTKCRDTIYGHVVNFANSPSIQTKKILRNEYNPYEECRIYKESTEGDGTYYKNSNNTFTKTEFTLSGTNWTTIISDTFGAHNISISSDTQDLPNASFILCKSDSSATTANIVRVSSSPASDTCELQVRWQSNTGIQIKKTLNTKDGTYYFIDNFQTSTEIQATLSGTSTYYIPRTIIKFYEKKSIALKISSSSGYPCSICFFSKNSASNNGTFDTIFSPGTGSLEKIRVSWTTNSLIGIYKTGTNYDGIYDIKFLS